MHRKIVVVDGSTAFVGGINFAADHLLDLARRPSRTCGGAQGPIVARFIASCPRHRGRWQGAALVQAPADAPATLPTRRKAKPKPVRDARQSPAHRTTSSATTGLPSECAATILIANVFLPRLHLDQGNATRGSAGVDVRLILQGPRHAFVKTAAGISILSHPAYASTNTAAAVHQGRLADDQWALWIEVPRPAQPVARLVANVMCATRRSTRCCGTTRCLMQHNCKQVQAADSVLERVAPGAASSSSTCCVGTRHGLAGCYAMRRG